MLCRDLLEVCNNGSTDAVFLKIGGSSSFFKAVNEILVKTGLTFFSAKCSFLSFESVDKIVELDIQMVAILSLAAVCFFLFFNRPCFLYFACKIHHQMENYWVSSTLIRFWFGFRFVAIWNSFGYITEKTHMFTFAAGDECGSSNKAHTFGRNRFQLFL